MGKELQLDDFMTNGTGRLPEQDLVVTDEDDED